MLKALKMRRNIPVVIKPFDKTSGTGDASYKDPINTLCYAQSKNTVVVDTRGTEVVSGTQLYLYGGEEITEKDEIVFFDKKHRIKALGAFFSKQGVRELVVVYL